MACRCSRILSKVLVILMALSFGSGGLLVETLGGQESPDTRFRVFVMISTTDGREPRLQIGRSGVPFFGRDVVGLRSGQDGIVDETDLGSPLESLSDLPAGDYFVQAMLNVYTKFERADGHTVWMHKDQWEGQSWKRSPGNGTC